MLWINLSHVHWHWRDDDLKEVPEIGMEYFISYTQKRKRQQKSFKGLESCVSLDPCLTNVEKIGVRRCDYNRGLSCKGFTVLCFVSCVLCRASCVLCYVSCVMCQVSCVVCHVSAVHMDPCMWGKSKQEGAIIIGDWLAGVCLITSQDARATHCHHCKQVVAGDWRKRERNIKEGGILTQK